MRRKNNKRQSIPFVGTSELEQSAISGDEDENDIKMNKLNEVRGS